MKMKFFSFAVVVITTLFSLSGCTTGNQPEKKAGELAGSVWKPENAPGTAFVEFTGDDRVIGCAGVNRFFGPVSYAKGKRLRLGPLASTRMTGKHRKYEEHFFSAMEETRGYVLEETKLTLYNESRQPVMVLLPVRIQAKK